jgi:methylated-DNA-[protein]-cysteine S-methyltransferase
MTLRSVLGGTSSAMRVISSPVGAIMLSATAAGLTHVQFGKTARLPRLASDMDEKALQHLDAAQRALEEYFAARRTSFDDLVLTPAGTPFQIRVWRALRSIPFGRTATYGEIARKVRCPGGARAVGLADNRNPIAVIVPCHRVIGANGSLTGYAAGLEAKAWLLRHEGIDI